MGRVGMVLDLVAEFVMGRVCQGPSYGPRCPEIVRDDSNRFNFF